VTHYDPHDWEPNGDPDPPKLWPVVLIAVLAWSLVVGLIWSGYTSAAVTITDPTGKPLGYCAAPMDIKPRGTRIVCDPSPRIFADGMEATWATI